MSVSGFSSQPQVVNMAEVTEVGAGWHPWCLTLGVGRGVGRAVGI